MKPLFRLGLIINPIAGMGGKVGLHGTDGDSLDKARALGATPISRERARRTLSYLQDIVGELEIFAPEGEMGYALASELGFSVAKIEVRHPLLGSSKKFGGTFAVDTRDSARAILEHGVDLILFAGGDGTARDVHSVIGESIPILGIPTGVKMRSGVFATNPESAGDLVRGFVLKRDTHPIREVEILDHSEISNGGEWPPIVFFGQAKAPYSPRLLQSPKSTTSNHGEAGITSLCDSLAETLDEDTLYLFGPGTTTKKILTRVGHRGTPLGVDATAGRRLIARDLSERQILALLSEYQTAVLFLGVIGGQGFLLGRGNQQISGDVINRLKVQNIVLLASAEKISNLTHSVLHVDVGDPIAESSLEGYRKVHVAPGRSVMCRVVTPTRIEGNRVAV